MCAEATASNSRKHAATLNCQQNTPGRNMDTTYIKSHDKTNIWPVQSLCFLPTWLEELLILGAKAKISSIWWMVAVLFGRQCMSQSVFGYTLKFYFTYKATYSQFLVIAISIHIDPLSISCAFHGFKKLGDISFTHYNFLSYMK